METTTKLLDAAEKRMRIGGYNAVSFRDLAADTGIKSSSVHYHFPKKEDLGTALIDRYSERFFEALSNASANATTPVEKLEAYTKVFRTALVQDETMCLCGLLGAEVGGLPIIISDGVQTFFKTNIVWLEKALPDEIEKTARSEIASTLFAAHQGAMMLATSMKNVSIFDDITSTSVKQALSNS